ncbi:hypothetical protein AAG614_12535 [Citromicrobium bathyomarinum]
MPDAPSSATERAPMLGGRFADPLIRALAVFLAGMVLLLALDLVSEPSGRAGEDIAIDRALSGTDHALATVVGDIGEETPDASDADSAERRERAQSAAFFVEQANLAWRRGEIDQSDAAEQDRGASALLAFLGELWTLGWLLLPLGALSARLTCPATGMRHPQWPVIFAGEALGGSAAFIALALALHQLGLPARFVLAPLVSAIVVLNAWRLRDHARLDRATTLLRLAPLLVLLTVILIGARIVLVRLGMLG